MSVGACVTKRGEVRKEKREEGEGCERERLERWRKREQDVRDGLSVAVSERLTE